MPLDTSDAASTSAPAAEVVAQVARVQPLWALLRASDRARYMLRAAQAIVDEFDDLRKAIAREQERPETEIAVLELLAAIDALRWIGRQGARVVQQRRVRVQRLLEPTKRARVAYEPYGVVGVIGAGSAPFAQPFGQIAGALLAGNGVVFKPSPRARGTGERIVRLLSRAGLPEGLVHLLDGDEQAGMDVARAPIGKLLFTGSAQAGRELARECVAREVEVALELGGKDAAIVLSDARVEHAAAALLWAACAGAGQARGAMERVYAAPEVHDRLVDALVARARSLRLGDPGADPGVQVGPLASERRVARVHEIVQEAVAQGAVLHCGGPAGGRSYAPAVLTGVTHEMRAMREPLPGPVLAVMAFESVSQAIALANDTPFGLGASLWSGDRYRALRIARLIDTGMVWINDHLPGPMLARGPWGAAAGSGLGKTLGVAGLRACAQEKLIAWDPAGVRGLWWGPYDELAARAAETVAQLRSAREADRERAWRHGALALARHGARTLARR